MVLEPWQWALAALAAFLMGLSKTGITGLGIFAVVIFASILPARDSVGVVLVILIAGDLVAITVYRREADWKHLFRLFPWAAIGVMLGALAVGRLPDQVMRLVIGAIVMALALLQALRSWRPMPDTAMPLPAWATTAAGLLGGFTTMVANAAGPLMVIYLLAARLPKLVFVGTAAWYFFVLNLFKVPFSYSLGLINLGSLGLSLQMAPFAILGALSGRRLIRDLDQRAFELIALTLTVVTGIRLLLL